MASIKACGCKGIRTCLLCEEKNSSENFNEQHSEIFTYCSKCGFCWPKSPTVDNPPLYLGKFKLYEDFLSFEEEASIVSAIDQIPWMLSQSGRKKQDFGPKVNFKKKKGKVGDFQGFPQFSEPIVNKIQLQPELSSFRPVELCNLEYTPERGSAIDPHIDDSWLWGERLLTINLVSSTILTLTPANINDCKCYLELKDHCEAMPNSEVDPNYNCNSRKNEDSFVITDKGSCVLSQTSTNICECMKSYMSANYGRIINPPGLCTETMCGNFRCSKNPSKSSVCINLPPRSLLVLAGCARHNWYHEIKRQDIKSRRIAMTFRELAEEFLASELKDNFGKELLDISKNYCNFSN